MPVRNPSTFRRGALTSLIACAFVAACATDALAAITCKPVLSIKNVRELRSAGRPVEPWTWKATIVADARYCATKSGNFEIDVVLLIYAGADMQFTEKYRWTAGQFDVSIELGSDEAIEDYRVGFIAPCVCREIPYDNEWWRRGTDREP